jgi:putative transposase
VDYTVAERIHAFGSGDDVYLQARSNAEAVMRFFRRPIRSHGRSPRKIVTDRLGSYGVASRAGAFKHWNEVVAA